MACEKCQLWSEAIDSDHNKRYRYQILELHPEAMSALGHKRTGTVIEPFIPCSAQLISLIARIQFPVPNHSEFTQKAHKAALSEAVDRPQSPKKQKIPCYFPDKQGIKPEHGSLRTATTAIQSLQAAGTTPSSDNAPSI
jgi:hypothetical protein